jgi:hypothetical protein
MIVDARSYNLRRLSILAQTRVKQTIALRLFELCLQVFYSHTNHVYVCVNEK